MAAVRRPGLDILVGPTPGGPEERGHVQDTRAPTRHEGRAQGAGPPRAARAAAQGGPEPAQPPDRRDRPRGDRRRGRGLRVHGPGNEVPSPQELLANVEDARTQAGCGEVEDVGRTSRGPRTGRTSPPRRCRRSRPTRRRRRRRVPHNEITFGAGVYTRPRRSSGCCTRSSTARRSSGTRPTRPARSSNGSGRSTRTRRSAAA